MASRRTGTLKPLAVVVSLAGLTACNPYQNFSGEFYAGPIDATQFAAPYLGTLPGPADQSGGEIDGASGFANDNPVLFYMFPFTADQTAQADPLAIDPTATPKAYVFDPTDANFPDSKKCVGPKNYLFDQRTDTYRKDQQGVIFESTPADPGYIPVVAEDPVTSNGEKCNDIKSKKTVLSRKDVTAAKDADGKLLAFAMVDPGANVTPSCGPGGLPCPAAMLNGLGPEHLGFYNQYLVAFIDGGYVPTEDVPMMGDTPAYTRMKAQTLYTPTLIPGMDAMMNPTPVPGMPGAGFDILDAARGGQGYSPVCHMLAYTPDDPLNPKTSVAALSATEMASTAAAGADLGYVFCLQPF